MRILMLLALLPACSLYFGGGSPSGEVPPDGSAGSATSYSLTTIRTLAGAHRIVGVDSDHAGGVWIAYQERTSSEVTLAHLDASNTTIREWSFEDPSEVSGIAVAADGVWVSHNAVGTIGTSGVTEHDLTTGTALRSYATEGQISDLEIQAGLLLLSSYQNQVIALDPTTGGTKWQMVTQVIPSTQTGIAAYGANLFVSSWDMNTLTLMDHSGGILGSATSPLLHTNVSASVGLFLANDGADRLILASDSQIAWLKVPAIGG
ncbi:MAG: hypothetical protein ABI467_05500 [Kofleriaceae bacterium]